MTDLRPIQLTKMESPERMKAMGDAHVWRAATEDLISGTLDTAFKLTFGGSPEDADRAATSAVVCFCRYRVQAAKEGRFTDTVYVVQRRGREVYLYNVPKAQAHKYWRKAHKYL